MALSSDPTFNALPAHIQRRIDRAFISTARSEIKPHQNVQLESSKNVSNLELGGGFIVEGDVGGGFVVEDTPADGAETVTHIPMSSIPTALQHLDLPPDDEQVLSVFRNAASGWSSASNELGDGDAGEGAVSLEDWRTVCAVLFEHHDEEYEDDSDGGRLGEIAPEDDDDAGSDDQYLGSEGSDNDDSDDEYVEGPTASSARRRARGRQTKSSSGSPQPSTSAPKRITARQKQTCLDAFALFFPSVPPTELASQKIMIKDIQRVAKVLGEKIKADEVRGSLLFSEGSNSCL